MNPNNAKAPLGRLVLMPNTLDFGCLSEGTEPPDLRDVIPMAALQAASRLQHWVAENAKTTRAFLKRVDAIVPLQTPLQGHEITVLPKPPKGGHQVAVGHAAWDALLAPALAGHDLGLISEAGLPGVADPGAALVLAAHRAGVQVLPLSGPSSLVLAVAGSGLNGQSFAFVGYLPTDAAQRTARLRELEAHSRKQRQTQLVIETPYRNQALAQALIQGLHPETMLSFSVGLTLADGWCQTRSVAQWRQKPPTLPDHIPAVFAWLAS
jgi:16S rRNA (cytidine1402-2'-O)-methyltransferase